MSRKILVVDDDPTIRELVQSMLQAEGHTVVTAPNGKEGVKVLDEGPRPCDFDLVILDVCMPEMNGLDVATRLKLHSHTEKLPVLMLTGEDKPEDMMNGYSVGADYYITKPFTRQQLLYGLQIVLENRE